MNSEVENLANGSYLNESEREGTRIKCRKIKVKEVNGQQDGKLNFVLITLVYC